MLLQEVIIEDFLSIANAKIVFPQNGLVLITGWNETLNRANGAGKSAIMQSLCWCLYGEFPRDIKVDEIIRRGQSGCSVTIKMTIAGEEWVILRKRPVDFVLSINGQKVKGNPKTLQAMIEQAIGFNYKQFLVTSFFPQKGDESRFIKQKDSSAKEFLGIVLNFSKADQAYKKLHLQLKDTEVELSSAVFKYNTLLGSISSLTALTQSPLPELPNKEDVISTKNELDLVKANSLAPPDTTEIDGKIDNTKKKQKAIEQIKYQMSALTQKITQLTRSIGSLEIPTYMSCPSCGEHLIENNGLVVFDDESAEQVKKLKEDELKSQIIENNLKLNEFNLSLSKVPNMDKLLDKLTEERSLLKSDYLVSLQKQKTLETQLQSFKRMFEAHQNAKEQRVKVQKQLDDLSLQVTEAKAKVLEFEKEIKILTASKLVLSPTGAIAYSLDSVIEEINSEVTSYLDIFSHGIMSYRMSSGEDKAKIAHHVTYEGDEVSVGSLSGGEEKGHILSLDLGLSEVLAKRCGVPLPSILMLDECFEGLDYIGKEKVIESLREVAQNRCIIVIDHHTEFSALFNQRIKVVKKNNISTVEIE